MRSDIVLGAVGGLAAGYVLWLVAFSIVDDNAAVGQWAPTVLLLSLALAVCADDVGVVAAPAPEIRSGRRSGSGCPCCRCC